MQINDRAIILAVNKYSETSAIIKVLTYNHGTVKSLARGAFNKQNRGLYQIGNIVNITKRARLQEQLGNFSGELLVPAASICMNSRLKLGAIASICALINKSLVEYEIHQDLFEQVQDLIILISNSDNWLKKYVLFEVSLLQELGFRMDLSECAVSGDRQDLIYISPKTARAVSAKIGKEYQDKLFRLPRFLIEESEPTIEDIKYSLDITRHFLSKFFFLPHEINIPIQRKIFVEEILENVTSPN